MPIVGQPGSGLATDVPGLYDVVINGMGYMLLASLEPNLPFRSHRAIYSWSPTFVDRQNVSGNYGDNQQAFWLTAGQNDWSLGQQQRYYRLSDTTSTRKAWLLRSVDPVSIPGQLTLRRAISKPAGSSGTAKSICPNIATGTDPNVFTVSTSLASAAANGTITNQGTTGAGTPSQWGLCTDGVNVYVAGSTNISKWNGSTFTSFSASTSAGALAFNDNLLFSCDGSSLNSYSSTGGLVNAFTWKDATGTALPASAVKIIPFGGNILAYFPNLAGRPQLWQYDGTNTNVIAELPASVVGYDITLLDGVVYLTGLMADAASGFLGAIPIIYYYSNGSIGELWRSNQSSLSGAPTRNSVYMPALGTLAGRLLFTDPTNTNLNEYDPATGCISTVGAYSLGGNTGAQYTMLGSSPSSALLMMSSAGTAKAQLYPDQTSFASSGVVESSLIDFESSLAKQFHSVKVQWEGAGSFDLAYAIDSLTSYTTLKTSAVTDTEYPLPAGTTGNAISVQVTINNTSSATPTLKRTYVRAAPIQDVFRECTYILDLTGVGIEDPVRMNDDQPHMLSGYEQAENLVTAIESQTSFSVTDKLGTFVALADPANCSIFEWREGNDSPEFPGCYVAQIAVKQVG